MKHIEKLNLIREKMDERGIDAYLIPSSDPHISEYLPDRYKCVEWVSGFTGSAGTLVITQSFAGLWTDSRYFVQAGEQLQGTGFELVPLKKQGAFEYVSWIGEHLPKGSVVSFDGKLASVRVAHVLDTELQSKGFRIEGNIDVLTDIWQDRPELPTEKAFLLTVEEVGQSVKEKLKLVRKHLRNKEADMHVVSSLDDVAWILNIRGSDVPCNPVVLSFLWILQESATLFIDPIKLNSEEVFILEQAGVKIENYTKIFQVLKAVNSDKTVWLDPQRTCYAVYSALMDKNIVEEMNPSTLLKSVKNDTEIQHVRNVMVKDGVALTKFFKWLEENVEKRELTEISISEKLREIRSDQKGFVDISFDTIAGYLAHGALPHYKATDKSNAVLQSKGLLLVDSGGQYRDGTTDITRVISLGGITNEEKKDYTLVLKGMIEGSTAVYPKGTCGYQIDALTRKPLWDAFRNYGHGTGHGVGFFLNVHEGPQILNPSNTNIPLEKGMISSIEPGLYREGKYGIRIENLVLTKELESNGFGDFYGFETLTLCYIDTALVDKQYLEQKHISWLNNYNKLVFEKLSESLNPEEEQWLAEKTKAI